LIVCVCMCACARHRRASFFATVVESSNVPWLPRKQTMNADCNLLEKKKQKTKKKEMRFFLRDVFLWMSIGILFVGLRITPL
jgi:hypothetical protein